MLGETNLETERHLTECAICRAEVDRLREAFSSFRHSVHQWSDRQLPSPLPLRENARPARTLTPFSRTSLAVAAVALCLILAFSLPWRSNRTAANQSAADAALLSQIDAEISRTVPGPMEPLTEFISNDASAPDATSRSARQKARP
jgi:anti-sigma factor RsiW